MELKKHDPTKITKMKAGRKKMAKREPAKTKMKPDPIECQAVANLSDDLRALHHAHTHLSKTMQSRHAVLFATKHDLSKSAAQILRAFHDVSSGSKAFEQTLEGRCNEDADVASARNIIQECVESSKALAKSIRAAGQALRDSTGYAEFALRVVKTLYERVTHAASALGRAIYNRKAKLAFAMIVAMMFVPTAPAIASSVSSLLGIGPGFFATSGAAGSMSTLLLGMSSSLIRPVCDSITSPAFVMGASLTIGVVMFLKLFPEVDHYIQHSVWSDSLDDDEDIRKFAAKLGWSGDVLSQINKAVHDAKKTLMSEKIDPPPTAIERAAAFASLMLAGGAATLVMLGMLTFAMLPLGLMSVAGRAGCAGLGIATSTVSRLGMNLIDRPMLTSASLAGGTAKGWAFTASLVAGLTTGGGSGLGALGMQLTVGGVSVAALAAPIAAGFGAGLGALGLQHVTNHSMLLMTDPRSTGVRAIAGAVQKLAAVDASGPLALASSPLFTSMCVGFGTLLLGKYGIDALRADEDRFVAQRIGEMTRFVTGSEVLDSASGFTDLVHDLSESQRTMQAQTDDIVRTDYDYRSLARALIRGGARA